MDFPTFTVTDPNNLTSISLIEIPEVADFKINLKQTEYFGYHIELITKDGEHLASFPWWDNAEIDLRDNGEKAIPVGKVESAFYDLEQSWQIIIFEKDTFIYIFEGGDPGEKEFRAFKVKKDIYFEEWKKVIDWCKSNISSYDSLEIAKGADPLTVKSLDLKYKLREKSGFPKEILQFINLEILNLSSNNIELIPDEISLLKNLQTLTLSGCKLKILPKNISKLKKLKKLFLNNNEFEKFPIEVCEISSLEILDISSNEHQINLPKEIEMLTNLKDLYFSRNKSNEFPKEIGNLESLEEITIDDNSLESLPDSITKLEKLIRLQVTYNKLKKLPESVSQMKSLRILSIFENRIEEKEKERLKALFENKKGFTLQI